MIVLDSDHLSVFEYPEADQAVQFRERLKVSVDRDIGLRVEDWIGE